MMQANTGVRFETKDPLLSQLVKQAEEKCRLNIKYFGGDPVLVEGGGYEKIWLETQPMGGAMYASRDFATGLNIPLKGLRTDTWKRFWGFSRVLPAVDRYYFTPSFSSSAVACLKSLKQIVWIPWLSAPPQFSGLSSINTHSSDFKSYIFKSV